MRLNKYIANSGYCSRRKADKLIEDGLVKVNGQSPKLGDQINDNDIVTVNGEKISNSKKRDIFLMFNKPYGVISSLNPEDDNSLLDYIPMEDRIFYIGRLDVNSTGLMIFTNNGDVANKITQSKYDHEKEYVVTIDRKLTRRDLNTLKDGVIFDGKKSKPARLKKVSDTRYDIVITEGRNRQIRKMFEVLGYKVRKLRRVRIMNVKLGTLGEGNIRELTKRERRELLTQL